MYKQSIERNLGNMLYLFHNPQLEMELCMMKACWDSHQYNFLNIFNELACKGITYQLETLYPFSE